MTFRTLIRRSLCFHWRSHLGVVLGAAIGSAALIGALVVGDSVKESLREQTLKQLGRTAYALAPGERSFREELAGSLSQPVITNLHGFDIRGWQTSSGRTARFLNVLPTTTLVLDGVAASEAGGLRANHVLFIGTAPLNQWHGGGTPFAHFVMLPQTSANEAVPPGETWVNQALAQQLNVEVGNQVVLRVQKSTMLPGDSAISARSENSASLRLKVTKIVPAWRGGEFNLRPSGRLPMNAFVNLLELQLASGLNGRANRLLFSQMEENNQTGREDFLKVLPDTLRNYIRGTYWGYRFSEMQPAYAQAKAEELLRAHWSLADAEADLRRFDHSTTLVSKRVFLAPALVRSALAADTNRQPILTYLATQLRAGTNATPYSMITAAGSPWTPADLRDDEIVVSRWLAEDLRVIPGDEIALSYFLPESGAKLIEATNTFRVRSIVPMEMPWADRTLMPDFPGIEKAESTSEWDAGFPLTYKVRPKDDDYWKQHRGTPKTFITLAAGQKMWANRFGNLTAIRFPIPTNAVGTRSTASQTSPKAGAAVERVPTSTEDYRAALEEKILAPLKPEELGLRFEPVREQALKAAAESQDFGGLFLGFSFFVIGAALLLMALLFSLGLEQRAPEIGTLLALGFTPKQVRKLLLREGVALAFLGGVIGALGGLAYAKAMLHGLTTIWRDAVGTSALSFHYTMPTLAIGLFASVVVSVITIWLTLRKFVRRPACELLVGEIHAEESRGQSLKSKVVAAGALLTGMALAGWAVVKGDTANAGIFFGAGALVLVSGLSFTSVWLAGMERRSPTRRVSGDSKSHQRAGSETGAPITLGSLAVRGCARRRKRSLATVAMLACGSFLIVSIGVFRLDANRDATKRSSGTGGFALIGETTMPVVQDLNSKSGREFFALNEIELAGVSFVPFRVREGDEASCLNLNRAQKPRLLGVKPEMLEGRFAFAKRADGVLENTPWATLQRGAFYPMSGQPLAKDEVAAIGDANSIQWAMHKKVGDTIDYVDERGQPFKVRIVGAVANSILQGQLIIDEAEFVKRFPGESGYRMFLVDAPSNAVSQVSATLSRAMQDVGLELTPAAQRLAQFNAVQNTYLGTFQVLGGLGLLLGSVGLGIVVLRNVLERRGELAVLLAVGFRKRTLQRLLLIENGALLVVGLALGVVAAAVAVLPALFSASAPLPYASLVFTLAAVLVNGALWTWAATRVALRGDLLAALRNE